MPHTRTIARSAALTLSLCVMPGWIAWGVPPEPAPLVRIPVQVTDPLSRFVTGLQKETFRLFEDDVEQEITQFSSGEVPVSIGIVIDANAGLADQLPQVRDAVATFLATSNPHDEYFLVSAGDHPDLLTGFTNNKDEIGQKLASIRPGGSGGLSFGLYFAARVMNTAKNQARALVVIAAGGDNIIRPPEAPPERMRQTDVPVHTITVAGRGAADLAGKLAVELRNQYLLGYTPKNNPRDGSAHKIRVDLVQPRGLPPLRAWFRQAYSAPPQ